MNGPARSDAQVVKQAAVVLAIGVAVQAGWLGNEIALAALLVLAVAWPPRVAWRPVRAGAVLLAYVPFAVVWLLFVFVYLRGMHAIGVPVPPQETLQQLAEQGVQTPGLGRMTAILVVGAPLMEELVFRGYLLTALRVRLPAVAAQLVTAALFGIVHGWLYAVPIGVLGLFFGWLRARHDALLPSMLAHAVHNALTMLLVLLWPGHLELLYPR